MFTKEIINILNDKDYKDVISKLSAISKKFCSNTEIETLSVIERILYKHTLSINDNNETNYGCIDVKKISEQTYNNLVCILGESTNDYFNAVCGELLWDHFHKNIYAEISAKSYYSLLCKDSKTEFYFIRMALGICRIYSKYQVPSFNFDDFYALCKKYIRDHINDTDYCALFLIRGLLKCKKYQDELTNIIKDCVVIFRERKDYVKAIEYNKNYTRLTQISKDELRTIKYEIAKDYESQADLYNYGDPKDSFNIIQNIKNSMKTLNSLGNDKFAKEERKRLAKKVEPVKHLSTKALHYFASEPIDLTPMVKEWQNEIENLTIERAILKLINLIPIQKQNKIFEEIKNQKVEIFEAFSKEILDKDGKVRCIIPSVINADEDDINHIVEHKASEQYILYIKIYINYYLLCIHNKFNITKDDLKFIIENNPFIPDDRQESFLTGLVAGFNFDFITAISVLVPQIENAVRCLASICGAVVYKTADNGIEECLSIDNILNLPEVIDHFSEDFIFNLRVIFVSSYGIGMRNLMAHGLLSDDELNSTNAMTVWWYTLKLCCDFSGGFIKRLNEQSED